MSNIIFHRISYRNLGAVGNAPLEYRLDEGLNTLVTAKNGTGKSSLLLAICYGLFDKPFTDITKPQLINSINGKNLLVEIEFTIQRVHYKVIRGMKPSVFEIHCNGNLISQEAANRDFQQYLEKQVLRMNYKTFIQVAIIGAANFKPFMELPAGTRREVIEDLLDIKVFSTMVTLLKDRTADAKQHIQKLQTEIKLQKDRVRMFEHNYTQIVLNNQKHKTEIQQQLEQTQKDKDQLLVELTQAEQVADGLVSQLASEEKISNRLDQFKTLRAGMENNLSRLRKEQEFFKLDFCPTCKQGIDDDHKHSLLEKIDPQIIEIDQGLDKIKDKIDDMQTQLSEVRATSRRITETLGHAKSIRDQIQGEDKIIAAYQKQLDKLEIADGNGILDKAMEAAMHATDLVFQLKDKQKEQSLYDVTQKLLKDQGIKALIIKRFLPQLNARINHYLEQLDLFISFEFDDQFNETLKSRYRDKFTFASFSEGEKSRISMAILFAWRDLARSRSSVDTNLLILDDMLNGVVDEDGVKLTMSILNNLPGTSVFVISHADELSDHFDRVIRLEKRNNYTVMLDPEQQQ